MSLLAAALLWCGPAAAAPATVEVGIFVVNVDSVDGRSGWWRGDVALNSEWHQSDFPLDAQPRVGIVNGIVDFVDEHGTRVVDEGGRVKSVARQAVQLWFDGNYWHFPFDEQYLRVPIEVVGMSSDELAMIASTDPDIMGIAPKTREDGPHLRHFNTAQYKVIDWRAEAEAFHAIGMPYSKSRVTLAVHVRRFGFYYTFDCFMVPSLTILFSWGTFFLSIEPVLPRVIIVFVSWVAQFVHLESQLQLLPEGVWCWMFSAFGFSMTLLSMAALANIISASIAGMDKPNNFDLALAHDRFNYRVIMLEYLVGYFLMWLLLDYHVLTSLLLSFFVSLVHLRQMWVFYREAVARGAKDDMRELAMGERSRYMDASQDCDDGGGGDGG